MSAFFKFAFDRDEHFVRNSFEFVEFVKDQLLPPDYILFTLNVESLFANIPITLTKDVIMKRWDKTNEILEVFISLHEKLNFTRDIESYYSICSLDSNIIRKDNMHW